MKLMSAIGVSMIVGVIYGGVFAVMDWDMEVFPVGFLLGVAYYLFTSLCNGVFGWIDFRIGGDGKFPNAFTLSLLMILFISFLKMIVR